MLGVSSDHLRRVVETCSSAAVVAVDIVDWEIRFAFVALVKEV